MHDQHNILLISSGIANHQNNMHLSFLLYSVPSIHVDCQVYPTGTEIMWLRQSLYQWNNLEGYRWIHHVNTAYNTTTDYKTMQSKSKPWSYFMVCTIQRYWLCWQIILISSTSTFDILTEMPSITLIYSLKSKVVFVMSVFRNFIIDAKRFMAQC